MQSPHRLRTVANVIVERQAGPLRRQFCPKKLLLSKNRTYAGISDSISFKCAGKSGLRPKACRNTPRIMWRSVSDWLLATSRFVGPIGMGIKGGIAGWSLLCGCKISLWPGIFASLGAVHPGLGVLLMLQLFSYYLF